MSWPLLALSYAATSAISAMAGVVWAQWRVGKTHASPTTPTIGRSVPRWVVSRKISLTAMVIALLAIGVGLFILVNDRARDRAEIDSTRARNEALAQYSRCLEKWGTNLTEVLNGARDNRASFDAANLNRNETFAELIRVVTGLREIPPSATQDDIDAVLVEFQRADRAYKAAYAKLPKKDDEDAYEAPDLTCDAEE